MQTSVRVNQYVIGLTPRVTQEKLAGEKTVNDQQHEPDVWLRFNDLSSSVSFSQISLRVEDTHSQVSIISEAQINLQESPSR